MENNIVYRIAENEDIDNLVKVEIDVWGEEMAAQHGKWKSRIEIFKFGTWVAEKDQRVVGVVSTLLKTWKYPNGHFPTWSEATDNGYITNHEPQGKIIYGVDLSVVSTAGKNVASTLLQIVIYNAKNGSGYTGILGSRVPTLCNFFSNSNIGEDKVLERAESDPTVKFFLKNGFEITGVKKDYFPEDQESLGWGVCLKTI